MSDFLPIKQVHISAGGNRHPNAADWQDGILAFGSGKNVALWNPASESYAGIDALLRGHTDTVQAVRLLSLPSVERPIIISGAADKTVRTWTFHENHYVENSCTACDGSINTVSILQGSSTFISGAANGTISIYKLSTPQIVRGPDDNSNSESSAVEVRQAVQVIQSISLRPNIIPLCSALTHLDGGSLVFAVAGTSPGIRIFIQNEGGFIHAASLSGHEGWIRSLDFVRETEDSDSDILLASASQDKYARLWRLHKGQELPRISAVSQDPSVDALARSLSNKPHYIGQKESLHSITFEALLIGHEDWVFTAQWRITAGALSLLTTSADNSVSIWRRQQDSGYWLCETRLGEISAQKGSTTATGSAGGFWIGLWSPDGDVIASLGRTGSWRIWKHIDKTWQQDIGVSGHTKDVKDLAWAADGSFVLTTGSDQTTRLVAPWRRKGCQTWHETARPQIHGYDLNCIAALGITRFISGADEKLLRVFDMPRSSAQLLSRLDQSFEVDLQVLPENASVGVLGLSNKKVTNGESEGPDNDQGVVNDEIAQDDANVDLDRPPSEDQLSRYTLWPEHEKLYGHGYEISAVAASNDGRLVATACKASSLDHAVIRIYETTDWREVKPPLTNHNLTVTSLAFSPSDNQLLSVGRDRQWSIFERESPGSVQYRLAQSDPKGHSRMILDCSWAPSTSIPVFATGGRDKTFKVWSKNEDETEYTCKHAVSTHSPVTAVAFSGRAIESGVMLLAWGTEAGDVGIICFQFGLSGITSRGELRPHELERPAGAINSLAWRPRVKSGPQKLSEVLAVASDDHSVRLYEIEEKEWGPYT